MPSAMGSFWEQAGALWLNGALHGKVGGAFTLKWRRGLGPLA
jgi:NAD(P)H dehydrogenase (quinone)